MDSPLLRRVRFNGMRTGISFTVSADDRSRLEAIILHPPSPQKHVWRCRIVLLSADGLGTAAIMVVTAKSKTCVWRWQERFMHEGVDDYATCCLEIWVWRDHTSWHSHLM